jgi:hypothetical protein
MCAGSENLLNGKPNLVVSSDGKTITKRFSTKRDFDEELGQTRAGESLAKKVASFKVPAIVSYDEDRWQIVFQYIEDGKTLRMALLEGEENLDDLCNRISSVVLDLQRGLKYSSKTPLSVPDLKEYSNAVFVHGDLTVDNIIVHNGIIYVVDWSSAPPLGRKFNWAPEWHDLLWLVQSIFLIQNNSSFNYRLKHIIAKKIVSSILPSRCASSSPSYGQALVQYTYRCMLVEKSVGLLGILRRCRHGRKWREVRRFWKAIAPIQ